MIEDIVAEIMACPFEWGRADCCTAACDVHLRLTGVDPMASYRGAYHGPRGALRLIRAEGGLQAMAARMAEAHGMRSCGWHPGALGLAQVRRQQALVIGLDQPGWWAGKTDGGYAPVKEVVAAWRLS